MSNNVYYTGSGESIYLWVPPSKILSEKGEWKHIGHLKTSYKKPKRTEMELSVIKMKDVKDYCTYPECQYVCSKEIASITGRRRGVE